jgi:hypothetical protein
MYDPLFPVHRLIKVRRARRHWREHKARLRRAARNLIAQAVLARHGPFRAKVIPDKRRPARRARHTQRALAEVMA